jgi:hypothetical protein
MANIINGGVPTGELVLALDPANPICFNSGDTTCRNIITNGLVTGASGSPSSGSHTPSASNFPSYNASFTGCSTPVFDFGSGKGMNVEEDLGASSGGLTISMWCYKNSTSSAKYFTDGRNNGGQWFLSNYSGENINFTNRLRYNFDATLDGFAPEFTNVWFHLVVTSQAADIFNQSSRYIYLNGQEISVNTYGYRNVYVSQDSIDMDLGKNYRIGTRYTTSSQWPGAMGPIHIWKRSLSAAEVKQTFDAHRTRFTLGSEVPE